MYLDTNTIFLVILTAIVMIVAGWVTGYYFRKRVGERLIRTAEG
jgi:hypothetical protein